MIHLSGGTGGAASPADAPPELLLSDLTVLESLDVLQDGDANLVDGLADYPEEDLEVLGG